MVMVKSAIKKSRRKSQREAARVQRQTDAALAMEEDEEILFKRPGTVPNTPRASQTNTPDPDDHEEEPRDYTAVLQMVKTVQDQLTALVLDNTNIRAACDDLRRQCHSQGVAFGDLSRLVSQTREDQEETRAYSHGETGPHPRIRQELLDAGGNLRAWDIGISWQDGETFLHGVRITGQKDDMGDNRPRPATAAPYPPCPEELEDARRQPAMSTPYQQSHEHPPSGMSTPGFPRPVCIEMSDTPTHHFAGPRQEGRPAHRPAAPIQRFNSKSIGWPAWFRHFRAVADVQGWDKDQRALQMVSYLDEKAMNVAQELSDRELYNYDALVGLLSARFDPASRVSASRSRFHGRTRRHQEDADTYADSITELCRLGYPQSSPELRQELISEQFVRGQSDPELKKYLWVVIRWRGRRNHLCHRSCNRCSLLRVAWATRCDRLRDALTLLDRHRALDRPRIRIIALHLDHVITPGLSVSAVVSWVIPKFVAPNRIHLCRSGQVDGWTGRTDPSEVVEDPHRETKYRPGPNPHWPVCH